VFHPRQLRVLRPRPLVKVRRLAEFSLLSKVCRHRRKSLPFPAKHVRTQSMFKHSQAIVISLAVCILIGGARAQEPAKAGVKPDYSKEAFVVEQTSTRIVFENDGTGTRESSARIRIQSDAGVQRYGLLSFPYQNSTENIEVDYVRVRKPDGTVVSTPAENTQDMAAEITRQAPFYSDLREKHVAVKGLSVGDVLEFRALSTSTKPLSPGQFWYAYDFSHDGIILQEQLQISVPRDRVVKWKSPEVKPAITEEGARRVFTWVSAQLAHQSSEQDKTDQETKLYQAAHGRLPAPDVEISSFQSWEEVGRWYGGLQQERVKPTPEIRAKTAELTKGAGDDNAKLRAIYKYVSTDFRYIGIGFGIGRYQPHTAAEVLSNQYGDCKDKHTLLASLLDAAGIKAYPALIGSSREIVQDVPSPGQFDHVISAIPQSNGFIWLDTTAEVAPFAYLITPLREKQALVIPENEAPALVTIPADPPSKASQTFKIEAKLSDTGTLEGKIERTVQGDDNEILIRQAFRRVPMPQWKDLIQGISYNSGFAGDVSEVTAGFAERTDEPFHFAYTYTRKDYPNWSGRQISSPLPPMIAPAPDTKPSHPILLGVAGEIKYESRVELPKGYSAELPKDVDLKQDFADYHASYSTKNGVLTTERRLSVKLREVPVSEFEAYKEFAKAVSDDHEVYVALLNGTASTQVAAGSSFQDGLRNLPDSTNDRASQLESDAKGALQRGDAKAAIESLRGAVAADAKFTRAWAILASLLMASRQLDDGIDAFQSAIDADPERIVLYKAFGYLLMANGKFEQAIPILQKEIKIAPEDPDGPSNLGLVFLTLKRYRDAVVALESAVKLGSRSPSVLMRLGSAYLYTNNDSLALTNYEIVLASDSRPTVMNDIAYTMAERGRLLPTALEYAERAVHAAEESSAEINLSDLKQDDLRRMSTLAAYWDTLGWVYFRMSNLEQAERYLNAAWILSQDGVVATHLGQVYEREGKKEAAIRMYRLGRYRLAFGAVSSVSGVSDQMKESGALLDHLSPGASTNLSGTDLSDTLTKMRTFKLPRLLPGTVTAEIFLLLDHDSKIEDVKLIKGPEKLGSLVKALGSVGPHLRLSDESSVRFLRRGFLDCYPSSGCVMVLLNPNDVHSVD
jgi:tetratricopeptide (TPR) repeat protein